MEQELSWFSIALSSLDTGDRGNVRFNERLKAEKAKQITNKLLCAEPHTHAIPMITVCIA